MAAVAPIPATTVTVALPADPEEVLLCLNGAEALVAATESWLVWGPAHTLGAVTLPAPVACRLFLRRSAPGAAPADRQSARNASFSHTSHHVSRDFSNMERGALHDARLAQQKVPVAACTLVPLVPTARRLGGGAGDRPVLATHLALQRQLQGRRSS